MTSASHYALKITATTIMIMILIIIIITKIIITIITKKTGIINIL